jgi:polysaccharide biosynthesis/export protein
MRAPHRLSIYARALGSSIRCRKSFLILTALLGMCPMVSKGQSQREPIIPMAQSGGAAPSAAAATIGTISGMSDNPISAGEIIHINVFNAPDFTLSTRVSASGEIAVPLLGAVHVAGLSSTEAGTILASKLKLSDMLLDPQVTVTVEATTTGITVLGEVHSPGIFPPPGKHNLSDLLAAAGGLTANTGRIIEISNSSDPGNKEYVPWDPTMHNTGSYDRPVHPGDRVLVRACGIAYIGGNVAKPGAYSLCGSPKMTLSELLTLAGGIMPLSASNHTVLIRPRPDGTKIAMEIDAHKVLVSKAPDMIVQEDDVIYVPSSGIKNATTRALEFSLTLVSPLLYLYH